MADETWLDRLAVGDMVVMVSGRGQHRTLAKIVRAPATRVSILVGAEERSYRRRDGYRIGADMWYGSHIEEATPEAVATVKAEQRRRVLLNRIADVIWLDLPTAALERVAAALEAATNEAAPGAGGHDG